jgi:hypothetical protein
MPASGTQCSSAGLVGVAVYRIEDTASESNGTGGLLPNIVKEVPFGVNLALRYCSTAGTLWYVDFGFADSFPFWADDCTA